MRYEAAAIGSRPAGIVTKLEQLRRRAGKKGMRDEFNKSGSYPCLIYESKREVFSVEMSYRNKYIHYCVRILCMVLALLVCLPANIQPAAEAASDGMLRVKLTRLGTPSNITFKTTCDYYLASDPSVRIPSGSTVKLAAADGTISATVGSATQNLGSSPRFMRSKPGKYGVQFSPILDGSIYNTPDFNSILAAKICLDGYMI